MVAGLLLIGVLGIMVDIWLAILISEKGFFRFEIDVALHLGYSVRCSPGDCGPNLQDPFWTDFKERDGPRMEEERALEDDEYNELFLTSGSSGDLMKKSTVG